MIAGGYYAITGVWSWDAVVSGAPLSLGITVIIFGKHINNSRLNIPSLLTTNKYRQNESR